MAQRFGMTPYYLPHNRVKSVLNNGIGRYVCQLQRITFRFCKLSPKSRVMRDFIEEDLNRFAEANPGVVCYLEPVRNEAPTIFAEYLNGRTEEMKTVERWDTKEELIKWIHHLKDRSGIELEALDQPIGWAVPSVQGQWTPFTHQPTEANVAQFPNKEMAEYTSALPSASEKLRELVARQKLVEGKDGEEIIVDGGKLVLL